MDKQILELLTEMNEEMKSMRTDINSLKTGQENTNTEMKNTRLEIRSLKSEMNHRFDTVEAKLAGVGHQFESTNETRMNEMNFLTDKVTQIEKELYILKNKD